LPVKGRSIPPIATYYRGGVVRRATAYRLNAFTGMRSETDR